MPDSSAVTLCPAQKRVLDYLSAGLQVGSILRLSGGVGRGKTTVLKELRPTTEYFMRAVDTVKQNKEHYAAAQAQAFLQPKSALPGFIRTFVSSRCFMGSEDED